MVCIDLIMSMTLKWSTLSLCVCVYLSFCKMQRLTIIESPTPSFDQDLDEELSQLSHFSLESPDLVVSHLHISTTTTLNIKSSNLAIKHISIDIYELMFYINLPLINKYLNLYRHMFPK